MPGKFEAPRGRAGRNPAPRNRQPAQPQRGGGYRRPPKKKSPIVPILLSLLLVAVLGFGTVKLLGAMKKTPDPTPDDQLSASETENNTPQTRPEGTTETPTETTVPEPEHVVATATVSATGDLLMHKPIITAAATSDGGYNFDFIFRELKPYSESTDFAIANLETTLAGSSKPYQGYPFFNCPDEIVTAAKDAGFDMLLTANNHSFDTGIDGYLRTIEVVHDAGLDTLGTMASAEDPKYAIKEINGIRIGMLCYTYETSDGTGNVPALNGLPMTGATYDNINCYLPSDPSRMYTEVEQYLKEMKDAGVEATIMFIHWGPQEYALTQPAAHEAIAQKLCDLGIDVIIGGHPHVVQPMALLQSTENPEHKTYCLYSLGNAVSNQRAGISDKFSRYTESGVLLSVTFEKYSDGKVYVAGIDAIPTWVNMHSKNGKREYNILPLIKDKEDQWKTDFELTDNELTAAQDSYAKTMKIIGEGLTACQEDLAQAKTDREAYYQNLAEHPELATQPMATVPETTPETTAAEAA